MSLVNLTLVKTKKLKIKKQLPELTFNNKQFHSLKAADLQNILENH